MPSRMARDDQGRRAIGSACFLGKRRNDRSLPTHWRGSIPGDWEIVFVDMASQRIVARSYTSMSDPDTRGPMSLFESDHHSLPEESDVVSAIRARVSFVQ